jgi:hypothetical protein
MSPFERARATMLPLPHSPKPTIDVIIITATLSSPNRVSHPFNRVSLRPGGRQQAFTRCFSRTFGHIIRSLVLYKIGSDSGKNQGSLRESRRFSVSHG